MASKTKNHGFNIWLETDAVNFDEINKNFEKIDTFVVCTESGTKSAACSGGISGTTKWHYKKYSDGTIEMSAKMEFDNLKCNGGSGSPYYSSDVKVNFPFSLSSVYDVQMSLASNTIGWVSNITGQSVIDCVKFRVLATAQETSTLYKQVFITVKGVLK